MSNRKPCQGLYRVHDWEEVKGRQKCRRCAKLNPVGIPPYIRFWDHVLVGEGCWPWDGPIAKNGYGVYTLGKPPNHYTVVAHRYAYVLMRGPVPIGMDVDHICNVRACCNPEHLQALTHQQNMGRRPMAGKCRKGHVLEGNRTRAGRCKTCYAIGVANRGKVNITA